MGVVGRLIELMEGETMEEKTQAQKWLEGEGCHTWDEEKDGSYIFEDGSTLTHAEVAIQLERWSESTFHRVARQAADLTLEKNKAYGSSFSKSGAIMAILYPQGVSLDQMDDFLAITRLLDKLFRLATHKKAFGESPWRDILGYALLAVARDEENNDK